MFHKAPLEAPSDSQMHDGVKLVEFVVNNTPFVQFTAPDAQSNTGAKLSCEQLDFQHVTCTNFVANCKIIKFGQPQLSIF